MAITLICRIYGRSGWREYQVAHLDHEHHIYRDLSKLTPRRRFIRLKEAPQKHHGWWLLQPAQRPVLKTVQTAIYQMMLQKRPSRSTSQQKLEQLQISWCISLAASFGMTGPNFRNCWSHTGLRRSSPGLSAIIQQSWKHQLLQEAVAKAVQVLSLHFDVKNRIRNTGRRSFRIWEPSFVF